MADKDDIRDGKNFFEEVPSKNEAFYLKGAGSLDWGMQNRLSRIFNPATGKTVINRVYHLDRGYEKIEKTLGKQGPKIKREKT